MSDKFRVEVTRSMPWEPPVYFENFWSDCMDQADENGWETITVANHRLKPMGGKLIQTKTQGWYLRWDNEVSHTAFVLRWS